MLSGLKKLSWGFIFIMISFRLGGIDICPDIIGYVLFAFGLRNIKGTSLYFIKAIRYNIASIAVSILTVYRPLYQSGVNANYAIFGISLFSSLVSFTLSFFIAYNLFMGLKDIADNHEQQKLAKEAHIKWDEFKLLQYSVIFLLVFIYSSSTAWICAIIQFVFSIIIVFRIARMINKYIPFYS